MIRAKNGMWLRELTCNATFQSRDLRCVDESIILPILSTAELNCNGPLMYFGDSIGPNDARVFYGPIAPHAIYGSNSVYTCFGQWTMDFVALVSSHFDRIAGNEFRKPTELQKPPQ
jgi:hypothetical protein